jgi:hypothetical protein
MAKKPIAMDRADLLRLAAESGLDVRTVKGAIANGVDSLRAGVDRVRLRQAAEKLAIKIS